MMRMVDNRMSKTEALVSFGIREEGASSMDPSNSDDPESLLLTAALHNISEAIAIYDKDGCLVIWNDNFAQLYNYDAEDLRPGVHFAELGRIDLEKGNVAIGDEFGDGEDYLRRKAEYRRKLEGSFIVKLKDGRWIKTTDRPTDNGGFVSVQVDVTELMNMQVQLRYLAQHDQLTQLPNRNLFMENGALAIASAKRHMEKVSVLFIDVDDYKRVNDQHGHRVGDEVLREIAQRLKNRLRESDVLARIGGDEFVVLLQQQHDREAAHQVCRMIMDEMQKPMRVEGHALVINLSIGVATYPDDGETLDIILRKADAAMYEAKFSGKGQWLSYNAKKGSS